MKRIIVMAILAIVIAGMAIPVYAAPPTANCQGGVCDSGGTGSAYFGNVRPKYETSTIRVYTNKASANKKIISTAKKQGITPAGGWKPQGKVVTYTKQDPTIYSAKFRRFVRK